MLSEELKDTIQTGYRAVLQSKGYRARLGQRLMIAEIAKTLGNIEVDDSGVRLGESHICVIEAGTGTGKTLSYMLAALPIALARGKKLVVSTATVLLQEQLAQKDLPDLITHGRLPFQFAIAKGRGRYLCRSKLATVLDIDASLAPVQTLFEDELAEKLDEKSVELYQDMLKSCDEANWDGDRDSWSTPIHNQQWQRITTDHRQCSNRGCAWFSECSYFTARKEIAEADVIIANHDLVLADMALGGGALLPDPEDTLYVFDEAHHLPDKALSHFNYHVRINAAKKSLDQIPKMLAQMSGHIGSNAGLEEQLEKFPEIKKTTDENLVFALQIVTSITESQPPSDERQWRFELGRVSSDLRVIANNLARQYSLIVHSLGLASDALLEKAKDNIELKPIVEQLYPRLAMMLGRSEIACRLWQSYARVEDDSGGAKEELPTARWILAVEDPGLADFELWSSPVMVGDLLQDMLWSRCFGAVLTSATLSSVNQFDRTRVRMGLPQDAVYKEVPSPFDYQQKATFEVPAGAADPRQGQEFERALIDQLNQCVQLDQATLVIFTARQQMYKVLEGLESELKKIVIMQDDYSKQALIKCHRDRIDAGKGSVIFGLTSLTEGVDLPGNYVNHVIIAKLPFTVPSDPVEATLNEWLTANGRNPFWEISVPDASLRLKQACGRLLRSEQDSGRITLLDRRILTKSYGKAMLDSLPNYRRIMG